MRKCIDCKKGIPDGHTLIAVYDGKTEFHLFFCSWWHAIKWHLLHWVRRKPYA